MNAGPPVLKTALGGQGKKLGGKGKVKPTDKGKKPAVKTSTPYAVTSAGPSNLNSKVRDKAKVMAAMIQELMEDLQAIDQ